MPLVVGISFKKAGKVYFFDPAGIELHEGDRVVAETARGAEFGEVMQAPKNVPDSSIVSPLRKVVRKASESDLRREETNRQKEKNAYTACQQKIHQLNLPMKLIDAEYCFDGSQVTFFFSADARVDFRELVKDLAGALRTKVQLHQVGVRDEAKLFGGLGPCGRPLCCATFMSDFEPVSMKMAKEQSLFLNPLKFSGTCGKLMCCLKYEYPTYRDAKQRLPNMNMIVGTPSGAGRVVDLNIIQEIVAVELEGGVVQRFPVTELEFDKGGCPAGKAACGKCAKEPAEAGEPGVTGLPVVQDALSTDIAVPVESAVASPSQPTPQTPAPGGAGGAEGAPSNRSRRRRSRNRPKKS